VPLIQELQPAEKSKAIERILRAFIVWSKQEFGFHLYPYQIRVASEILTALYVTREDVAVAISRQSGKTEVITLLLRFLIIFHRLFTGEPLMTGLASPKGEQAKTSIDRIKLSIRNLGQRWQVEDREFNSSTVRAFRFDQVFAEIFKFTLAPSSSPHESKTLNLLIVDEAHESDDLKRSKELDPMLASTGGITVFIGVGCTRLCDFQRAKTGQLVG
jgi:phage terminase large subunit-like protein